MRGQACKLLSAIYDNPLKKVDSPLKIYKAVRILNLVMKLTFPLMRGDIWLLLTVVMANAIKVKEFSMNAFILLVH